MFRKSSNNPQMNLFTDTGNLLNAKSRKKLEDPKAWHNLFREHILMNIDEEPFRVLYDQGMGAPNVSIRQLLGMMILKESVGCSDKQLFEQCDFNLLYRSALGLINLDDALPAESTYYLLRRKIFEHEKETKVSLFEQMFTHVTSAQVKEFNVDGKMVRMDSKLIGSNIAWYTRFELIHETLRLFYSEIDEVQRRKKINRKDRELLATVMKEEGAKIVYRSTREEVMQRIEDLGPAIKHLLLAFKSNPYHELLDRLFKDLYKVSDGEVRSKDNDEIDSNSLQSPHDPDCTYRDKGSQKTRGYSVNLTETCSDDQLNLITDVQVKVASTSDTKFFEPGLEQTKEVTGQEVEKAYCDGAYHSPSNYEYAKDNNIDMVLTGIQGTDSQFRLERTSEGVQVTDTLTGIVYNAIRVNSKNKEEEKWRIKTAKSYRYFGTKEFRNAEIREKLKQRPREELNKRNNVEASVFQLGYHLDRNKTRYRGLCQNQAWAISRCLWVNLVRIKNIIEKTSQRTPGQTQIQVLTLLKDLIGSVQEGLTSFVMIHFMKRSFVPVFLTNHNVFLSNHFIKWTHRLIG